MAGAARIVDKVPMPAAPLPEGEHSAVALAKARTGLREVFGAVRLPDLLEALGPRRLAILRGDCATVEGALRIMAMRKLLAVPVVEPRGVREEAGAATAGGGSDSAAGTVAQTIVPMIPGGEKSDTTTPLSSSAPAASTSPLLTAVGEDPAAVGGAISPGTAQIRRAFLWNQSDAVGEVLGFVGVGDIIASFTKQLDESLGLKLDTQPQLQMLSLMKSLERAGKYFGSTSISTLVDDRSTGLFTSGDGDFLLSSQLEDLSVLDVICRGFVKQPANSDDASLRAFTSQAETVHRLVVVDAGHPAEGGKLTAVFSQTDCIRWLCGPVALSESTETHDTLPDTVREALSNARVKDLPGWDDGKHATPAICVPASTLAIQAVHEMLRHGLRALGVVDMKGRLIGNFSMADLRGIKPEHLGAMALPVAELIAWEHATEYSGFSNRMDHPFALSRKDRVPGAEVGQDLKVCTPESSLLAVLRNLAANKLHRLWVLDSERKPLGVVSTTDIMELIAAAE